MAEVSVRKRKRAEQSGGDFAKFPAPLVAKVQNYRFCVQCGGVKERSHSWNTPLARVHEMKTLKTEEKIQLLETWVAESEGGAEVRAQHVAEAVDRSREQSAHSQSVEEPGPWTMNFGKYSKPPGGPLTVRQVMQKDPGYFAELALQGALRTRVELRTELENQALLEEVMQAADARRKPKVEKRLSLEASGASRAMHPEVRQLHQMQLVKAHEELMGDPMPLVPEPVGERPIRKRAPRKPHVSVARTLMQNCSRCGVVDHKVVSCPLNDEGLTDADLEKRLVKQSYAEEKKMIACKAHLKHVSIDTRTSEYENRKARRALNPTSLTFLDFARATPLELCKMLIEDGLLMDLQGAACLHPKCEAKQAFLEQKTGAEHLRILGPFRAASKSTAKNIDIRSVCYRCLVCRTRVPVNRGSMIYPCIAGGFGVTQRTHAFLELCRGSAIGFHLQATRTLRESLSGVLCDRQGNHGRHSCQTAVSGGLWSSR